MKTVRKLTLSALMVALMLAPIGFVGAQTFTYTSGFQIQNLSSGTVANVTATFYNADGTVAGTLGLDTINPLANKTYFPLSSVPSGFQGSAVVSSNTPIASIVNVLGNFGASNSVGDSYSRSSSSVNAPTVSLPLVMKNNFGIYTWFSVQNTGAVDATVTVSYGGTACTENATIKPYAARIFDQSTNSCLPASNYVGNASISNSGTNQPLTVVLFQVSASSLLGNSGLTPSDFATTFSAPSFLSKYFGNSSSINIANVGASATNVTITYAPSSGFPGNTCTETKAVNPNSTVIFGFPDLPAGCYASGQFAGSARVTANSASQNVVAVVNTVKPGSGNASAYTGFTVGGATNSVSMPLIMDRNFGIFTGIAVTNVGASATNVNCTFSGTSYTVGASNLQPGQTLTDNQVNKIANGYVGAGTCAATGGDQKIVGVVNQLNTLAPATADGVLTYPAINYVPGP